MAGPLFFSSWPDTNIVVEWKEATYLMVASKGRSEGEKEIGERERERRERVGGRYRGVKREERESMGREEKREKRRTRDKINFSKAGLQMSTSSNQAIPSTASFQTVYAVRNPSNDDALIWSVTMQSAPLSIKSSRKERFILACGLRL